MSGGDWKDMFAAACRGDGELVRYHLEAGVDPDYAHPEYQETPLVAALLARHEDVALLLLDHGADPALRSVADDLTPLAAARAAGMRRAEQRLRTALTPPGSASSSTRS
jgi:ankyrin repeat protein